MWYLSRRDPSNSSYLSALNRLDQELRVGTRWTVRRRKPTKEEHHAPERSYFGHKEAVGMNTQVNIRHIGSNRSVHEVRRAME